MLNKKITVSILIYLLKLPFILTVNLMNGLLVKLLLVSSRFPKSSTRELLGSLYRFLRLCAFQSEEHDIRSRYNIHQSVTWGYETRIYGLGEIQIDEGTYIGQNSFILSHPENIKLKIGKHCAISHNVNIRTEVHHKVRDYKEEKQLPPLGADVVIGDYVWIGANVFIKGGITIGDNVIIGANSVVTHDIPSDSIYGGVPARLIRNKDDYLSDKKNSKSKRR